MKREGEKRWFFHDKPRQFFSEKNRGGIFYNQKGQVTLFIIIAIIIAAAVVAVYFFFPGIFSTLGGQEQNPNAFIQTCMEDNIKEKVDMVSSQGGNLKPEFYFTYNDINITYLCYTNENYKPCIVQQPLLQNHIESEVQNGIEGEVKNCFNELKSSFEGQGYAVTMKQGDISVELLPQRVISTFNYTVTLTKAGETKRYESFSVVLNNNLYELAGIAKSIIEWEATYGDVDPRTYMTYYPDLKVEKNLRDDGTRIYILTDRNTKDKFQFASRSLVFPPGH